jgi:mono/diheme cytochrome c family protein
MVRKLVVWVIASTLGVGYFTVTFAAESSSGKQMYLQYCSSCHGKDGKGDGTVSRDLKVRVPEPDRASQKKQKVCIRSTM